MLLPPCRKLGEQLTDPTMARKNQSVFEDLVGIAALLPWWAGVLLAAVSYFVFHHYAGMEITFSHGPGELGASMGRQLYKTFALYLQYIVPALFLIGAAISAYGKRRRAGLLTAGSSGRREAIANMSWREFEMLVGEVFRRQGYSVVEAGGQGADGGVDLVLTGEGRKSLVQCKQWKAYKVGVQVIREMYGVMTAAQAERGYVITSGVFTKDARSFAQGKAIELIDGAKLQAMISGIQAEQNSLSIPAGRKEPHFGVSSPRDTSSEPLCPRCGSAMVKRTAKRGTNAGTTFWGCTRYPGCRGVRVTT